MALKKYSTSEVKNQKWISEGRGGGRGSAYKPWLTVRDVPSEGRSHRIFGHKSQRTHHLLSDLELAVFLLLEWHGSTIEVREQFPLSIDLTRALAEEAGIEHPAIQGILQIMSSDFLVDTNDLLTPKFVLQAKYVEALQDSRTIEKLEIERRYWLQKDVPWMLITEQDIPKVVFQNINWLYPAQRDELDEQTMHERVEFYAHHFDRSPEKTVIGVAKRLDVAYELPEGHSLLEIRQLMARRCFLFDILIPSTKLKACELRVESITTMSETPCVPN